MSHLIDNIKQYFLKLTKKETVSHAPEGMCPVCWGHSEWDGKYYEIVKDKHLLPGEDIYESFISKIVDKHVSTTHKHGDKYICTSCDRAL